MNHSNAKNFYNKLSTNQKIGGGLAIVSLIAFFSNGIFDLIFLWVLIAIGFGGYFLWSSLSRKTVESSKANIDDFVSIRLLLVYQFVAWLSAIIFGFVGIVLLVKFDGLASIGLCVSSLLSGFISYLFWNWMYMQLNLSGQILAKLRASDSK
jgi:drug/metabolite transporter (DMT)-like permease